jgi:hypothetical protein
MQESLAAAHKPLAKFAILGCEVTQLPLGTNRKRHLDPPGKAAVKKKRAVRVNERPKSREETPKEGYDTRAGPAMSHRKSYWCAAPFSNAFFAELPC